MTRRYDNVSLLTDYGTDDEFVGLLKAVIADIAPGVRTLDLTHGIAPYDVRAGSLALARCISYVPEGVIVAVVDPGVGTQRRAIAVEVADGAGVLIGPDNGLLAPAVALAGGAQRAVELVDPRYRLDAVGATFAGRDVFAPAAAHLCNGVPLTDLGPLVDADLLMPATIPLPRTEGDRLITEVLWVDRYGNCQLNVGPDEIDHLGSRVRLAAGSETDPHGVIVRAAVRSDTFADIGGGIGLVTDSYGMIAICCDRRSAADELALDTGAPVVLGHLEADEAESVAVRFRT